MLAEIELDILRFLDRASLEGLQMHSKYLRDVINRQARSLPLRYIHAVTAYTSVYIRLLEDEEQEFMVMAPGVRDLEMLFHRVNNAFIHRLEISFRQEYLHLLFYLRANTHGLQCQIRVLHIGDTSAAIDYALAEFLGLQLKPQVYEAVIEREHCDGYSMLFTRNAFRGNVRQLLYYFRYIPVPDCIIGDLFGVDVTEACAITTRVDPSPWISKFVKSFEMAERGAEIVRSVVLLLERYGDESLMSYGVESLGRPRRTNGSVPQSAFLQEWARKENRIFGSTTTGTTVADLFVFENGKSAKKLELSVWSIEHIDMYAQTSLHYAFFLEVVDT